MENTFLEKLDLSPETAQIILQEHNRVVQEYETRLRNLAVDMAVRQAVTAAGGRNLTAIRALLDETAFGDDPETDARQAVAAVKRDNPYLFVSAAVTAPGTGTPTPMGYTQEELGKLSLAEYRRYRKGQ